MAEETTTSKVNIQDVAARVATSTPEEYKLTPEDSSILARIREARENRYSQQNPSPELQPIQETEEPSMLSSKFDVPTTPRVEIEEPVEESVEEPIEEPLEEPAEDPLVEKRKNKETNIKNLRNALKSSRDRVSELELELENKNKELERLSEIDDLKAQLQEKEERLQQLKSYEDVVSLYGTEGFKEKFYDSVDTLREQAVDIASDYGVDEDVIDRALQISNQRQLNDYLSNYFDTFAVQDIRGIIKEAQQIITDRQKAESEPARAREILLTNVAKRKEAENIQARKILNTVGTDAWNDMAAAYSNKESGVALLQEKQGNKTHNALRESILKSASQEYGKTLAVLAQNGLKELPPTVARAMASRYQLGEAAAHAIVQAESLRKENQSLKEELKKFTDYNRPLSSGRGNTVTPGNSSELKGKALASFIYSQAESKIR